MSYYKYVGFVAMMKMMFMDHLPTSDIQRLIGGMYDLSVSHISKRFTI
jgi:hypothetical protein